ncbi:amidohydrolase family protein [Candidatus Palauibacter sp.]|uniref:amidohydrolase family protein n=1 Tax=Candidatus Palauibacter sp. TaxID=3101350 RepID=UPI003B51C479
MIRKLAGYVSLGLLVVWAAVPLRLAAQSLAVTGATLIDPLAEAPLDDGVVVMMDGRITAVGPASAVDVPAGTSVIDARGKYVIPGLMDANLHLYLNLDLETLIKYEGRYHEIVLEAAQLTLKSGQTTVFDTWGPLDPLAKARGMINAGEAPGSRIYFAGNIIGFDGPLSRDFRGEAAAHVSQAFVNRTNEAWERGTGRDLMWMTPDSVRAAIREYTGTGVDFLKYGSSSHVEMYFISFSERVQRAIVEEGHRAGMTVQTHTTSVESLDMAIEAGVDIITHGDISGPVVPIPMETMRKLVERDIAVSVLPITQRRLEALQEHNPDGTLTPYMVVGRENQARMIEAGVSMLLSTDAGIKHPVLLAESATIASDTVDQRTKLGEGHFNALAALEELGMAPMEILRSATSHIARAYELEGQIGSLQPEMIADLVILDENPLEGAGNYRSIHAVIKDGRRVDLDALPVAPIISVLKPEN